MVTEMSVEKKSQPQKPPKTAFSGKRIGNLQKVAILMEYEEKMLTGKTTEEILPGLSKRWGKQPRQIQRYIEEARQLTHHTSYEELAGPFWRTTRHPLTGQWLLVRVKELGSVGEQGCTSHLIPTDFIVLTNPTTKRKTESMTEPTSESGKDELK